MKSRLDYKSKRIAIIVVIAIILFAIASISTYFFIKGNADTQAAKLDNMAANEQNSAQEQRTEGTTATPQSEANQTETTEQVNNDQETEETTQQINTQTTNVGVNPQTTTTDTGVQENITTRTETQVVENTNILLGFTQQALKMDVNAVSNLNGNMPNIKKEIVAVTKTNLNGILNGDEITYEIKITNESTDILEQINASAVIPEGTELVEGSISDEGVVENGKIIWKIDVDQEKTIYFTVKVLATEGIISANAVIEGKETEVVQTPILKATLAVDKTEVSKNETLTYTVSIENTANISAQMKVEAVIPENTQLETEGLNVKDKTISWDKTLAALEKAEYSYTVKVNKYEKDYNIENAVKVNGFETNKVSSRIIDIIPPEIIVKEESIGKDPYFSEVSFKLHDDNLVDKIIINGTERDLSDNAWSDANYQNIKDLLHEGENTIVLVDVAGNKTEKKFIMDWTAPEIIVKEESIGKDPYFSEVSFKLHDNNLVDKIIINGTERDLSDNAWSDANYQNIKDLLHEGENTIVLVDVAGNKTEKKFTMDWTAPTITVKEESKGKDPYFSEVSFKLYDNNKVDKYLVNDKEFDVGDAKWSDANYATFKSALKEGENIIVLVDIAGNRTEKKFIIDWTPATITVKEESKGKDPYFSEVSFKLYDNNKVDKYLINDKEFDVGDAKWGDANYATFELVLKEGENTIVLIDIAGNRTEKKFIMDWTAPTIKINGEKEITLEAGSDTYKELGATVIDNFDATIDNLQPDLIHYYTYNKETEKYTFSTKVDCVDTSKVGLYKVSYTYTDVAGNKGVNADNKNSTSVIRFVYVVDTTAPVIKLNGEKEITLEAGIDTYGELGATVTDNVDATIDNLQPDLIHYYIYNNETGKYVFSTKVDCVDTSKVGLYKVSYTYTDEAGNKGVNADNKNSTSIIRFVYVVDTTAPTIELNGDKNITLEAGIDTYEEKGATVRDNVDATIDNLQPAYINYSVDGKFVGKVDAVDTTKVGTYKVVYEYTDTAGNKGVDASDTRHEYVIRIVTVQDTTKPLLKLNGDKKITLEAGIDTYEELGTTMIDNVDPVITNLQPAYINYSVDGKFVGKVDAVDTTKVGTYKVVYEYTDAAGNKGIDALDLRHEYVMRTVIVQDTIAPTATVEYSTTEITNRAVMVTLTASEPITLDESAGTWIDKGNNVYQKSYPVNNEQEIKFKDLAGNEGSVTVKITNIDKVAPTATVEYTTTELTNRAVMVTLTASESITLDESAGTWLDKGNNIYQKSYPTNKEQEIKFKDLAGNEGSVTVKITNIDKTAPTATVEYSTTEPTNGAVIVTLKASEAIKLDESAGTWLDKGNNIYQKSYPANNEQEIKFKDLAGNEGSVTVRITNIDKTAPTATIEYSTTEPTNGAVIVTLKASEAIKLDESAGTWLDKGNNIYQKSYPANKEQEIKFKDLAGNEGSIVVKVTNIQ